MLIGGGSLDDPISSAGSKKVLVDIVPLYAAFPTAGRVYGSYFSWDADKNGWDKSSEPRMIVDLPRSSRFYSIMRMLRQKKGKETLTENEISLMVLSINQIWTNFSSYTDPDKRCTAILDAFFDEVTTSVMLRMGTEHAEATALEDAHREQDDINGISNIEDHPATIRREGSATKVMRKSVLDALKGIAMSVYDIMSRVNRSEDSMATEYQSYISVIKKRIADTKEEDRFRELVKILQSTEDTLGDTQLLFAAFNEFVITPITLIEGLIENVTYMLANLYMQVVRCLSAATVGGIANDALDPAGGNVQLPYAAAELTRVPLTMAYGADVAAAAGRGTLPTFSSRINAMLHTKDAGGQRTGMLLNRWVFDATSTDWLRAVNPMTYGNTDELLVNFSSGIAAGFTNGPENSHLVTATMGAGNLVVADRVMIRMYQPIYRALQAVIGANPGRITTKVSDGNGRTISLDANALITFIEDSIADLKTAIIPFMNIGRREHTEKYFREITAWSARKQLTELVENVNDALAVVNLDYYVPNEYIPSAVCVGGVDAFTDTELTRLDSAVAPATRVSLGVGTMCQNKLVLQNTSFDAGTSATTYADNVARPGVWKANFVRNLMNGEFAQRWLNHIESAYNLYSIGQQWEFVVTGRNSFTVPEYANVPYERTIWEGLGAKRGIFAPIVSIEGKTLKGTGLMPWSSKDVETIIGGLSNTAKATYELNAGIALNSIAGGRSLHGNPLPMLYTGYNPGALGPFYEGTSAAKAGVIPPRASASHFATSANPYSDIYQTSTGNIVSSSLYCTPGHGGLVETLNRLLVKMASVLTLQGERPVVLNELAKEMVSNSGITKYFRSVEYSVTPPGGRGKAMIVTAFPETLATPIRIDNGYYVLALNAGVQLITVTGTNEVGDLSYAADYEEGQFLYDVVISPFHFSLIGRGQKTLGEMSKLEMSSYLAFIPVAAGEG